MNWTCVPVPDVAAFRWLKYVPLELKWQAYRRVDETICFKAAYSFAANSQGHNPKATTLKAPRPRPTFCGLRPRPNITGA